MPVTSKYSKKDFKKDLKELTHLINQYKGGSAQPYDPSNIHYGNFDNNAKSTNLGSNSVVGGVVGGKPKKASKSSKNVEHRSFTIIEVDNKKIPSGEGRYTIKVNSTQTPRNAAVRACSSALSKRNKTKLVLKLRETTAGSEKTVKCYECSKTKLKTPQVIKRKGSEPYTVYYKTNVIEKTK